MKTIMTQKMKGYLGVAIVIALLAFAYASLSFVGSYSKLIEPSSFRSFSVSGEGKVVVIPDVAQFTFSVITEGGTDISKLQKENTDRVNRAIGVVKAEGVKEKDIKTQRYSLDPRYQYYNCGPFSQRGEPCPPRKIVGYTVTQSVLVKVRDFEKIGKIFSFVIDSGANSVSRLSFTVDDPTEVENEARAEAIKKAKEKAKLIAKAGDFGLGRLLSIQEGRSFYPAYKTYGLEASEDAAFTAPSIEPGSQDITVSVTLVYEIK